MHGRRLIPSWIPPDQPLYLGPRVRRRIRTQFDRKAMFLNIPYAKSYSDFEIAIISTVTAYGLIPRMAKERLRTENRLLKIVELILSCQYGLADLSYATRLNIPFELGLLMSFAKETLVICREPYAAIRALSDLNSSDANCHHGSIRRLIIMVSRWIEQVCIERRHTTQSLFRRYKRLQLIRRKLGEDFE